MNAQESTTTRPYLIRALHEWCTDNGFTPYLAVRVDDSVQVPREYVKDGEIVLNVGIDATNALQLGNDFIEFTARFGGKPRDIMVPVGRVIAIYARENGQGMAFPPPLDVLTNMDESSFGTAHMPLHEVGAADADGADDERVVQLVPTETAPGDSGDAPRPPPHAGPKRAALKRVK
ncbi:ClpXP protease specificity-enhancing factor [Simplicispira psychrophila]|uniref:ClpXP protease specificity-enhancing factor n=1 Tax=Simplicispira psychrophila TaxID=80882 RepID=UPI000481D887|nr:ClpXP protease specificity-enhancing factor [Simplicispira psychrophila]